MFKSKINESFIFVGEQFDQIKSDVWSFVGVYLLVLVVDVSIRKVDLLVSQVVYH